VQPDQLPECRTVTLPRLLNQNRFVHATRKMQSSAEVLKNGRDRPRAGDT
jgi:hypothetical protein